MPGFFDLPPEVRFMIYRWLLPKQTLRWKESPTSAFISCDDPIAQDDDMESKWTRSNTFLVNRQIFTEMYPLLYSQHSFHITASTAALSFFRQIGQLNREALREIHLDYMITQTIPPPLPNADYGRLIKKGVDFDGTKFSSWKFTSPRRGFNFFNVLAKCSNAAITIVTTFRALALLDGSSQYPAFVNMHGFKKATTRLTRSSGSDYWPRAVGLHTRCRQAAAERLVLQRLENGTNRMESPCPKGCRVHQECTSVNTSATVHLEIRCGICWECAHNDFLGVWVEKKGCIFGLQQ